MSFGVAGAEPVSLASAEQAIGPYLHAIRRHWLLVTLVTLLAGAVAAYTAEKAGKTYQATASILVTPQPEVNSSILGIGTVVDSGDPARTVQTAAALIDTPEAATAAAQRLGRGYTEGGVASSVSVTPLGASNVLAVTAQAGNPRDAAHMANAFANGALAYRAGVVQQQISRVLTSLEARLALLRPSSTEAQALASTVAQLRTVQGPGREPTMSISQLATPPGSPTGTPTWLIVLLALAGGLILGSVASVAVETFSRPVRDRAELESLYNLPILASLPRVRSVRRRDLPPWELTSVGFEQIRMLRVQLSLGGRGQTIMVSSAGAGDGKTTVAAALAAAYAEVDQNVVLIDLDIRKPDLTRLLGVQEETTATRNGRLPRPIPVPRLPRVNLVPAPTGDLAKLEGILHRLPDMLSHLERTAGCVIIDTAPVGEVSETLRIASMCDQVVVVARPRHTDRRRLRMARDLLERANARTVGLVLTGEDPRSLGGDYGYGYAPPLKTDGDEAGGSRASRGVKAGSDVEPA